MPRWWGLLLVALALWPRGATAQAAWAGEAYVTSVGMSSTSVSVQVPYTVRVTHVTVLQTGGTAPTRCEMGPSTNQYMGPNYRMADCLGLGPGAAWYWEGSFVQDSGGRVMVTAWNLPSGTRLDLQVWGERLNLAPTATITPRVVGVSTAVHRIGLQLDTAVPDWPLWVVLSVVVGLGVALVRGLIRAGG